MRTPPTKPGEPHSGMNPAKLRLAFQLADECGLSRSDRIDLAEILLAQDVPSWKALEEPAMNRLLDAMRGFLYVRHLRGEDG